MAKKARPKQTWKLSPKQKATAIQRYVAGEPLKHIAADYGVSTSNVVSLAIRDGHKQRRPWNNPHRIKPPSGMKKFVHWKTIIETMKRIG